MTSVRRIFLILWGLPLLTQAQLLIDENTIEKEHIQLIREKTPRAFTSQGSYADADQALRALGETGSYERVFLTLEKNKRLKLSAKPIRYIRKISFRGVEAFSKSEVNSATRIEVKDRFDRKRVIRSGEALKALYEENGYFNANIEISFVRISEAEYDVSFNVKENEPCRISEIIFSSANKDLSTRLFRQVKRSKGRILTQAEIESIRSKANEYLVDKNYLRSEVLEPEILLDKEKKLSQISFKISEPFRYRFLLSGYETISRADVYRASKVNRYERTSLDPVGEISENIRQYYLSKGYPAVKIQRDVSEAENSFSRTAQIKIIEGPKVEIENWIIEGRVSRPLDYYIDFIKNNSSELVKSGYFNRENLDLGYSNLVTHLKNQGYLKARIQSARVEYQADPRSANLIINLDEGPLTIVQSLVLKGNLRMSDKELSQILKINSGSPLLLKKFEDGLEEIVRLYRGRGYLEAKILTQKDQLIRYNSKNTLAQVQVEIFEGPLVRLESVTIEGNDFTDDYVIRKELDLKKGQVLTPEVLDDATDRLTKLGVFSRANLRTLEEGSTVADRTLIVSVVERDPGTFKIGIGANNERELTLVGHTGVSYSNLGGTGRAISGKIKLGSNISRVNYLEREILLGYLEPFMFDSRTRGRVNLVQSEEVETFDEDNDITQIVRSNRIDLLLEKDLTRNLKVTWKVWSLNSVEDFERKGYCLSSTPQNRTFCGSSSQQVAKIGPIFDLDYRDSPFLPTKGTYSRLSFDYSSPGIASSKSVNFYRVEGLFSFYLRLFNSPNWVFANSIRGGFVENPNPSPDSGIPASEAFILGGIGSVRGFSGVIDGDRIPNRLILPFEKTTEIVVNTRSSYQLFKSELRFPIFGWLDGALGGVLFYDGGAVSSPDFDRASASQASVYNRVYRDTVGIGIRYNTPFGPVSGEWGYKLNRLPNESKSQFHFSIGTF